MNNKLTDEPLNLDTAIVHAEERATALSGPCAAQHAQLAMWLRELQERRETDSAEPVSFDELNAAVAEVTGCNPHAWDASIYKGHQAVPFMNYNSLARIVDKYRTPPAPVSMKDHQIRELVNDLRDIAIEYHGTQQLCERIAHTVRAAMLQAGNSPVVPEGLRLALSNAGIAAPESDEMLAATHEKYTQMLVTWVRDRKPFQPALEVPDECKEAPAYVKALTKDGAYIYGFNACRAAMLSAVPRQEAEGISDESSNR